MWLLSADLFSELQKLRAQTPTPAQIEAFSAVSRSQQGTNPALEITGNEATVHVRGALTNQVDIFTWLMNASTTTYGQIQAALGEAQSNPAVKRIKLMVNSGGGHVDGLFETLAAIQAVSKPMRVEASFACSAAYALAAAAGPITATSEASSFGSIGVAAKYLSSDRVIDITSTESPDKRPDPRTEEGQQVIRRHLDAVHDLFVEAIASGRGVKTSVVNSDYGRGAVLLAREAKSLGMIDDLPRKAKQARPRLQAVINTADDTVTASSVERGSKAEARKMTLEELKAQHPELYKAIVEEAVASERDRVAAHIKMGEVSGAMSTALEAVKSGTGMTASLQAEYMAAGMSRADRSAREQETQHAAEAVAGAAPVETSEDAGDKMLAALQALESSPIA